MGVFWQYFIGSIMLLVSLVIIIVVLLQQGRRQGINGAISGGADTFLSKTKARSVDAKLASTTKYFAIGFFILALAADVVSIIYKG